MSPFEFVRTIYLGDRSCKAIIIDAFNRELKVQVDIISRVRSATWNFYNDENLKDGYIVFERLKSFTFTPAGPIPDDYIYELAVHPEQVRDGEYRFSISITSGGVRLGDDSSLVVLEIVAETICLEDIANPGHRIRN